jgi:hypothetical protein
MDALPEHQTQQEEHKRTARTWIENELVFSERSRHANQPE